MNDAPKAAFVIDPKREQIAIQECRKLGIPVVAVVDSNCDPDMVDYIIPGNDDAIRAIKLFATHMADACLEGAAMQKDYEAHAKAEAKAEAEAKAAAEAAKEEAAPAAQTETEEKAEAPAEAAAEEK
jgi:small subunit ribosomal protein S2